MSNPHQTSFLPNDDKISKKLLGQVKEIDTLLYEITMKNRFERMNKLFAKCRNKTRSIRCGKHLKPTDLSDPDFKSNQNDYIMSRLAQKHDKLYEIIHDIHKLCHQVLDTKKDTKK